MHPFSAYYFSAEVAKSVDAVDSKSTVEIRAGSSPAFGTIKYRANKKPPRGGFFVPGVYLPPLPAYFYSVLTVLTVLTHFPFQ
jgi:hypothetical protein